MGGAAQAQRARAVHCLSRPLCQIGTLWPEFFRVPDAEWARYIQMDMRDTVLCRSCYEYIKQVIDTAATQRSAGKRHKGRGRR